MRVPCILHRLCPAGSTAQVRRGDHAGLAVLWDGTCSPDPLLLPRPHAHVRWSYQDGGHRVHNGIIVCNEAEHAGSGYLPGAKNGCHPEVEALCALLWDALGHRPDVSRGSTLAIQGGRIGGVPGYTYGPVLLRLVFPRAASAGCNLQRDDRSGRVLHTPFTIRDDSGSSVPSKCDRTQSMDKVTARTVCTSCLDRY